MLENLKRETQSLGKPKWRALLRYTAELHERSTHPPKHPFPYPWEEIGPGYCYGPAFGHWDLIHQVFDAMPAEPEHAKNQLLNNLANQHKDGFLPGSIWMAGKEPQWGADGGHPPVWAIAVQEWCDTHGTDELIRKCFEPLTRQIGWFEANRRAPAGGFFYIDVTERKWESGIDESVRFDHAPREPRACVDACSHMVVVYRTAARWAETMGVPGLEFSQKADRLSHFVRSELYDANAGFFFDSWFMHCAKRPVCFDGMWPLVAGIATKEQAGQLIREYLMNPARFFTPHPICTVARNDPAHEPRMWRGPSWNSMTLWAARGCLEYGFAQEAAVLVEKALDASAGQFERTGTVWEFYHPLGGRPEDLQRKPQTEFNRPCRDYLGHNPLIAMARMWEKAGAR